MALFRCGFTKVDKGASNETDSEVSELPDKNTEKGEVIKSDNVPLATFNEWKLKVGGSN